ncbi:J domain-containing protein [Acetivibrio cellulolyticus]|uniref:J domain-containing protein n=1 Tax=Acetivibrio cellulolyticus TaxID=35830 RepID=UPI0001E2BDE8|nr:J domain-containing protein [Acetivibrio cellulolyticus]
MISDPYKVLGVSPDDPIEEITKAYRRLAKKYHPDVNYGNEEAAKKMSEINAAYEQIKSGNTSQTNSSRGYSGQSSYGYGNNSSGENDPFGGFNPFGFDPFGGFGPFGNNQQRRQYSEFEPVKNYLRAGYYAEALNVLSNITNKSAEWYYYSAIANYNTDNKVTALNHAKTAVQMEPNNQEYQHLLNQIQNGGRVYQQQSQNFGMPVVNLSNLCCGLCLARLLCGC